MSSPIAGFRPVFRAWLALLCGLNLAADAAEAPHDHDHHHHEEEFDQRGVHEHGRVTLNVALDGQQLVLELDAPAGNVLGFEHAPRTEAEKASVRDKAAWLRAGQGLASFPPAAECRFERATVEEPAWKAGESHADYEAQLFFRCRQPQHLAWLQPGLLSGLPNLREARVNVATPARQGSQSVTSPTARIALR